MRGGGCSTDAGPRGKDLWWSVLLSLVSGVCEKSPAEYFSVCELRTLWSVSTPSRCVRCRRLLTSVQRENEQPSASDQQQVAADVGFAQPLKTVLGASCVHLLSDVDRLLLQLKFVLERPFDLCSGKQVAFKEARRRS